MEAKGVYFRAQPVFLFKRSDYLYQDIDIEQEKLKEYEKHIPSNYTNRLSCFFIIYHCH